jgi:glycosyltransferase involved in cell wall biosynthesis
VKDEPMNNYRFSAPSQGALIHLRRQPVPQSNRNATAHLSLANCDCSERNATVPRTTVVITTKNRATALRLALRSVVSQRLRPEIIVIDDGSTDGTSEMVRAEFPSAIVRRHNISLGLVVRRNQGAALASGDIIFSIDDDAIFSSPLVIDQTLRDFCDPRIGAVAIPFLNVNYGPTVYQDGRNSDQIFCTSSFVGTAHAIRKQAFLEIGGYREFFYHQGEEEDLCIRLLNAGYITVLGSSDVIHHFESPLRDRRRMHVYGSRNLILFSWYNVPMPYFIPHVVITTMKAEMFGMLHGCSYERFLGLMKGYAGCLHQFSKRQPVTRTTYKLFRKLKSSGGFPWNDVERATRKINQLP